MPSFVFRAVAGVVNGAACAVNHLLETICPVDIGHIWEEPAVGSCTDTLTSAAHTAFSHTYFCELPHGHAGRHKDGGCEWTELAAPADPHPAGVADPAAETVTPDLSAAGSPLTWSGWAEPAVLECLAEHRHRYASHDSIGSEGHCSCGERPISLYDWHEHIAPLIVERIACNPAKAVAALQNLQTQE